MKGSDGTIGLRVPDYIGLQQLLAGCEGLFSTSANKAGEPIPLSFDEIDPDITKQVAAIVGDYSDNGSQTAVPSTILDCSGDTIRVVREGAYPIETIFKKIEQ